jgi:DNA-binding CsgD family transcriptional regulator
MIDPMNSAILLLIEPLTMREKEVLEKLGEGSSNIQIGVSLFISERTVRTHLTSIFGKMNVETRLEAVLTAQQLGMVNVITPDLILSPEEMAVLVIEHASPGTISKLIAKKMVPPYEEVEDTSQGSE